MDSLNLKYMYNNLFFALGEPTQLKVSLNIQVDDVSIYPEMTIQQLCDTIAKANAHKQGIKMTIRVGDDTIAMPKMKVLPEHSIHDMVLQYYNAIVNNPEHIQSISADTLKQVIPESEEKLPANIDQITYRGNDYIVQQYSKDDIVVTNKEKNATISDKSVVYRAVIKEYRKVAPAFPE